MSSLSTLCSPANHLRKHSSTNTPPIKTKTIPPNTASITTTNRESNSSLLLLLNKNKKDRDETPPNALRRKRDPNWKGGFSLGVDLGLSRTGLAISKGFSLRPFTVVELRGEKLELRLLQLAEQQEVDEFIVGLPLSFDGMETQQSNKVRSVCGRLAVRAAERGWRVYLQDEHGTSSEAMGHMINTGVGKSERHGRIDAYAAMMVLERYFDQSGEGVELVLPKQLELQEKLRIGPPDLF